MLTIRYLDGLILALHNCACRNGLLWKQSIAFFDAVLPQLLSTRGYVESLYRIHVGRKSLYSLSYYTIDGTFVCLHWRCWRALRVTDWFRTTWIKMQRAYYPWCMNVKLRCLVFQYHTLRISVCDSESNLHAVMYLPAPIALIARQRRQRAIVVFQCIHANISWIECSKSCYELRFWQDPMRSLEIQCTGKPDQLWPYEIACFSHGTLIPGDTRFNNVRARGECLGAWRIFWHAPLSSLNW